MKQEQVINDVLNGTDITKLSPPEIEGAVRRAMILYHQLKDACPDFQGIGDSTISFVVFDKAMPIIHEAIAERLIPDENFVPERTEKCYDSALSYLKTVSEYLKSVFEGTKEFPQVYASAERFFQQYSDLIDSRGYGFACQQAYISSIGAESLSKETFAIDNEYMEIFSNGGFQLDDIHRFYTELSSPLLDDIGIGAREDIEVFLPESIQLYDDVENDNMQLQPIDGWKIHDGVIMFHHEGYQEEGWESADIALIAPVEGYNFIPELRDKGDNNIVKGPDFRLYTLLKVSRFMLRYKEKLNDEITEAEIKSLPELRELASDGLTIKVDTSFVKDPKTCMEYFGQSWASLISRAFENNAQRGGIFLSPGSQQELFTRKRFPVYDSLVLTLMQMSEDNRSLLLWAEHSELEKRGIKILERGTLLLSIDVENGGAFGAHRVFSVDEIKFNLGIKYREYDAEMDASQTKFEYDLDKDFCNASNLLFNEMMTAYMERYPKASELEERLAEVIFHQAVGGHVTPNNLSEGLTAFLEKPGAAQEVFSTIINTSNRANTLMKEHRISMRLESILPKDITEKMSREETKEKAEDKASRQPEENNSLEA